MIKLFYLFALLLMTSTPALMADEVFIPNMQPRTKEVETQPTASWHELIMPLPPLPNDTDLIELTLDGEDSPFRYFIDSKNLLVSADAVVRYTLVIESRSGSRNLSYEGIRCTPQGQYKIFAYGTHAQFIALNEGEWQPIYDVGSEHYRSDLWRFYFCVSSEFKPRIKPDILRSLKSANR
ncbi:CNP1-like family protein [Chromatium okenii]|uniref:CNP1-like family protein n=1 Tax=Chromatium okenii TaxID=61644 RepID=UPI0026EE82E2|nr:CNP1-like family protein [Chromatium okenii]MBV5308515.1 CNP1-like family protein [Chromatium okenii]